MVGTDVFDQMNSSTIDMNQVNVSIIHQDDHEIDPEKLPDGENVEQYNMLLDGMNDGADPNNLDQFYDKDQIVDESKNFLQVPQ